MPERDGQTDRQTRVSVLARDKKDQYVDGA